MRKCQVVIPTYNEANNLPVLVAEIWALQIPGLSVLIVDSASTDGTGEIADELSRQRPGELKPLHLSALGGLRRAYLAGFKWCLANQAELIIQMDCDFSHSPKYIPEMIAAVDKADLIIGSRYVSGGKIDDRIGMVQYFQSWLANTVYARLILNLNVKDATSGFRCWRADALAGIKLDAIAANGYSFQIEMAYVAQKLGFRIIEIPILFEERRIGRTKLRTSAKLEAIWRIWEMLWRYRDYSPATRIPATAAEINRSTEKPEPKSDKAG